jgi:GNAT superfamily N-acetyltransferase
VSTPSSSATAVQVRPARSRLDMERFIRLPYRLYRDEPNWVPPLRFDRRRHLSRSKNPFFEHAEAEYFLAWRDGRVVGRVSAHVDHRLNEVQGNRWGLFGFLECENSHDVCQALLGEAERWLRDRGRDRIIGPFDFSTNHECGLLVAGHEYTPQILENWHFPYLARLVEGCGLAKAQDLLKWEIDFTQRDRMLPIIPELAAKAESEQGIAVRNMRRRDMRAEVQRFYEVYNASWAGNWGFVPLTEHELDDFAKQLKPVLDERWAWVAEKDGATAGVGLTLPDYNQILIRLHGRLLPVGWLSLLLRRGQIDRVRIFALGVMPAHQHTGTAAALYMRHWDEAGEQEVGVETGWILESNEPMNRAMEALTGTVIKRWRIYEKVFA